MCGVVDVLEAVDDVDEDDDDDDDNDNDVDECSEIILLIALPNEIDKERAVASSNNVSNLSSNIV